MSHWSIYIDVSRVTLDFANVLLSEVSHQCENGRIIRMLVLNFFHYVMLPLELSLFPVHLDASMQCSYCNCADVLSGSEHLCALF